MQHRIRAHPLGSVVQDSLVLPSGRLSSLEAITLISFNALNRRWGEYGHVPFENRSGGEGDG